MARLVQVELWSDYIAAGGIRERILPMVDVFAALLDEDTLGKSDLSLTVNARIAALFGGRTSVGSVSVLRASVGLAFADSYTRANNPIIGNGWVETELNPNSLEINANGVFSPLQGNSNSNRWTRAMPAGFASVIVQSTFQDLQTFGGHSVAIRLDPANRGGTNLFLFQFATAAATWNIFNGVSVVATIASPGTGFRYQRGIIRDLGGGILDLSQYDGAVASLTDLSVVPTFLQSALGEPDNGRLPVWEWGGNMQRSGRFDMSFACGVDIIATGMPGGSSIRVNGAGGPTALEFGGVATLPADGVRLPYDRFDVLNSDGQVMGTSGILVGVGGFPFDGWGGDTWTVTSLLPSGFIPGAERKIIRSIFDNGLVLEHRIGG